jgi:hypothetical protein
MGKNREFDANAVFHQILLVGIASAETIVKKQARLRQPAPKGVVELHPFNARTKTVAAYIAQSFNKALKSGLLFSHPASHVHYTFPFYTPLPADLQPISIIGILVIKKETLNFV